MVAIRAVAGLFAVALLTTLGACGDDTRAPGALAGNYSYAAVQCNGGAGPAHFDPRFTGGRTWRWVSADGYDEADIYSDGTCTVSMPYRNAYPSVGTVTYSGAGAVACSPSAAACQTLVTTLFTSTTCGGTNADSGTLTYSSVPTATGGTLTLTAVGQDGACTAAGLTGPLGYVLTRE